MKLVKITISLCLLSLVSVSAYSSPAENKNRNTLPPGLQKRVESGKALPPGWQQKLEVGKPLDSEVYALGIVVEVINLKGQITIQVGGKLLRILEATREIVNIADIIASER